MDARRDRVLYYACGLAALALILAAVLFRADFAGPENRLLRYLHASLLGLSLGLCTVFFVRVRRRLGRWWWF